MRKIYLLGAALLLLAGCQEKVGIPGPVTTSFTQISQLQIGEDGAAEISAFDPVSKKLFVVNNDGGSVVDVIDFTDPINLVKLLPIDISAYGGGLNSVAVKNGLLAVAVEGFIKTDPGAVLVYETSDLSKNPTVIGVGALPDMVTFSPDGNLIITANEGEPNDDYSIDPVGSISIIEVNKDYAVTTLGFESFEGQKAALMANGFRIFGPGASFAQDIEPEYVTVDATSSFAWVTLQENNGMARVDLKQKAITDILPFGVKDNFRGNNRLDASDRDDIDGNLQKWPVLSYFLPDAISSFEVGGNTFVITANEGDTRDYGDDVFNEEVRVNKLTLDPTAFPNADFLQEDANLGRLIVTNTDGDTDGDGDFDVLYGIGARSFSIWNGRNGQLVRDYTDLERDLLMANSSLYDDGRSDNKGVEPESIEIGQIRGRNIVFVGLERADAIMVYELSGASGLRFLQVLDGKAEGAGHDAPEGLLFIPAEQSPNGRPLLVVSSEGDGRITVYMN